MTDEIQDVIQSGSGKSTGTEQANNSTPINIINVVDPRQISEYVASSEGQNVVLNVLSSRA